MKIFLIDNYDSFTYNLVHYLASFDTEVITKRNDEFTLEEISHYDRIVLSPGPGLPKDAGLMNDAIKTYHKTKPILGICLGHQALIEFYGGKIINLPAIYHGESSVINVDVYHFLFKNMENAIEVGRYHSWGATSVAKDLTVIAQKEDVIMGVQHQQYPSTGVQFHPESIMSKHGLKMIEQWINHSFD